ncbi:hypothetical protein AAY81_03850 [Denitrobacterium detoxificans]|uniref:DNA-3-methyladenine glycosylase III n=1 Tax=Denitrobacterium detoxificans TaxID=79604 RepID=A0A172RXQ5_9ACTN|nr:MptD family putative ECF transporter S component [Denitrobacterium detoxificans]ANE22403.1 hypothetical protein AAY81_03850 [Denitrobacterium detoxificans]SEP02840.1 DNA-3-methyladenine glycosylase III [Denitrobacterium detoxificans]
MSVNETVAGGSASKINTKLKPKDLITIGIFTAIYVVLSSIPGMLAIIPIFVPLAAVLVPLLGGIPVMYLIAKVHKFGALVILFTLVGLFMLVGGMGYFSLFTCIICAIIAELILRSGNYQSMRKATLAYAVTGMWIIGNFMPFVFTRDSFLAQQAANYGTDYANALSGLMSPWIIPLLVVVAFVSGLAGAAIGKRIYRKHFERAGIA